MDIDLIVLDLTLPDVEEFDGLQQLRTYRPSCPVVVFSGEARPERMLQAIERGACGFMPKSLTAGELHEAIELIARGHIYLPPRLLRPIGSAASGDSLRPRTHAGEPAADPVTQLSDRQRAILKLLLLGYPNKLIARQLGLALSTVKNHLSVILRVLGVQTRAQAILKVAQHAAHNP
jgi:DNA-binding NarL/FixJ family response regulator